MQYDNEMNRREALSQGLGCLAMLAVGGVFVGAIRGCVSSRRTETKNEYSNHREALLRILKTNYPTFGEGEGLTTKPKDLHSALAGAERVLLCYAELLQVRHPFVDREPFLNSVDRATNGLDIRRAGGM